MPPSAAPLRRGAHIPTFMTPVISMAPPMLWLIRTFALASLAGSLWLTFQKWLAPRAGIAGCHGSEACATLLDSRWSQWFFVPVTLLAATIWLAVLLLTLPSAGKVLGRTADQLLGACAVLLLTGAVWFGVLMGFVVKAWCPWCAALHAAALIVGGALLYSTWKTSRSGERGLFAAAGQAGIAGASLLILGQVFGKPPDTHLLTNAPDATDAPVILVPSAPSASAASALQKESLVRAHENIPRLGLPDATHVLTGFSDYTCTACRAQHSDLKALLKSAPETYSLLILPVPLDKSCNPFLTGNAPEQPQACFLAKLALALWQAAPLHFPEFHDFLMVAPLPISGDVALAEARRLAPGSALEPEAPSIATRLAENIRLWHQISPETSKLPKLILREDLILHGSASSRERFFEIITEAFAPPSAPSIPVSTQPR